MSLVRSDFSLPGQEVLPPTELASCFCTKIHRRVVILDGSQSCDLLSPLHAVI